MTALISRRAAIGAALAAPVIWGQDAVAQIRRGDELTVGVWGGMQERILREFVATPLEQQHGVKINFVLGGTTDRRARAYAERGRPSFDIVYLNIFESRQAVKDGVTQDVTGNVPNAAYLYPVAKLGGYGVAFNPVTIVYDKRKVAPMTSWRDFWRDDLKGKIIWPTYPGAQGTSALLMAAKIWGGSETNIDPAFTHIAALKPFAAIQASQDQLYAMFDQEVGAASIEFGSFTRVYAETRNPNIIIADPTEGQAVATNVACITTGTTKQALADAWVNLHLSPACQRAYAERIYYSPTVNNVELPPELAAKLVMGPAAVDKLVDFDWDLVIRNQARWSNRFTREIAG
ncbi:putative spermidine/putrescine transport system substrate-binding protein [Humitalea rosea]|uniref:Putative spermidine/putrescine transport system substrate-binding protein n=1 Tax=Humitalea rosea TaxID=990373 RepID=A0A2W7IJ18_9PROT|nr:extracellular solute-binding protein [Humitalea rosea]PZW46643.1 putative spermidine/putrescine transport system substrate-binding protein [Humitalea rosea]